METEMTMSIGEGTSSGRLHAHEIEEKQNATQCRN
jgi:hypothetical protein